MAKINKTLGYAISWLNSQNKSPIEIADELKITEKQVLAALEKVSTSTSENNLKTAKSPASRSQNLMIRETAGKKNNHVAIMTGEASALNDSLKDNMPIIPRTRNENFIFKPKNGNK
jgi:tyrosyl-tRNA synthetase